MAECASRIDYTYCTDCGSLRISKTNLCRDRLCPVCSWRLSLQRSGEMLKVIEHIYSVAPDTLGAMLTLTMRNCPAEGLSDAIDLLLSSWAKLRKRRAWRRYIGGYARSIEVTIGKDGTYHPHLHVLLLYRTDADGLLAQRKIAEMWRECMGVEYTPIVDIRRAYSRAATDDTPWRAAIAAVVECTKYALSGKVTYTANATQLGIIALALHNRRLISYGGSISDARAVLNLSDDDTPSDVSDTALDCPKCGSQAVALLSMEWAQGCGYRPTAYPFTAEMPVNADM